MREILSGIFHWTATHPGIQIEVSSYYLVGSKTLIDPLVPEAGLETFSDGVDQILLTNRHHYRGSTELVERYGCTVRCVESGLHEFKDGQAVEPFRFGDSLPGGIEAVEIGQICPDETALVIPDGVVALADGIVRDKEGPLSFVPDEYMGGDTVAVKTGLKQAYRALLERDFDHLLLAHGWPWVGGGKDALRHFVEAS